MDDQEKRDKKREYYRQYRERNRERIRETQARYQASEKGKEIQAQYRERNRARIRLQSSENQKRARARNPEKARAKGRENAARFRQQNPDRVRSYDLLSRYGITLEQYRNLLTTQNNSCAACERSFIGLPSKHVHIDHCHETKRIRGILCHWCNIALGRCGDSEEKVLIMLGNLLAYLRRHRIFCSRRGGAPVNVTPGASEPPDLLSIRTSSR